MHDSRIQQRRVNRREGNNEMERLVVAVFDTEEKAHEASEALGELDLDGVIAVYATALVTKDRNGETTATKTDYAVADGAMGATAVGTLIGMLGGPAGLAVGAAVGFAAGATADFARSRVGRDFVGDVVKALEPGKTAVVAEIDEESIEPVDIRMKALGGVVFRRAVSDILDREYEAEVAAIRAHIARTRAQHAASRADRRAKLQARLDSLNEKLHKLQRGMTGGNHV